MFEKNFCLEHFNKKPTFFLICLKGHSHSITSTTAHYEHQHAFSHGLGKYCLKSDRKLHFTIKKDSQKVIFLDLMLSTFLY